MEPIYRTGRIYKIINIVDSKIYIGSTVLKLCDRMSCHRRDARGGKMSELYDHMRNVGINNFYIELLREVSVLNIQLLRVIENEEITKYNWNDLLNEKQPFGVERKIEEYADILYNMSKFPVNSPKWIELRRLRDNLRMVEYRYKKNFQK